MDIRNHDLEIALESEGIKLLKSDNICIGNKIPLSEGMIGIIVEETEELN